MLSEVDNIRLPLQRYNISFESIKTVVSEDSPLDAALEEYYKHFRKTEDSLNQRHRLLIGQAIHQDSSVRHLLGNVQLQRIKNAIRNKHILIACQKNVVAFVVCE